MHDFNRVRKMKVSAQGLEALALFGGSPAFSEQLHIGRPNVGNRERCIQRLVEILDSRRLTNRGPFVEEFEGRVALISGVKHCNGWMARRSTIVS